VIDLNLNGMSGLELQRMLGEIGVRVPIIFITGSDSPVIRKEAEGAGCALRRGMCWCFRAGISSGWRPRVGWEPTRLLPAGISC